MTWKDIGRGNPRGALPMVADLRDPRLPGLLSSGADFLYMDNAYFGRSPRGKNFRLIRAAVHLTTLIERPDDRLLRLAPKVMPWRTEGKSVLIIPPSPFYSAVYPESVGWLEATKKRIQRVCSRPIVIKATKNEPLEPFLARAWACVTFASVAGLEAALFGVPVFSTPRCCTWPINAGELEEIDSPRRSEREPWLAGLAYATWSTDELDRIDWNDYQYNAR